MSLTGYSMSKLSALLRAQDRQLQLEQAKAQRDAAAQAAWIKTAGMLPGAVSGLYSAGQQMAAEDLAAKQQEALLGAGPGELDTEQALMPQMPPAPTTSGEGATTPGRVAAVAPLTGKKEISQSEFYGGNVPSEMERTPEELLPPQRFQLKDSAEYETNLARLMGLFAPTQTPVPEKNEFADYLANTRVRQVPTVKGSMLPGVVSSEIVPGSTTLVDEEGKQIGLSEADRAKIRASGVPAGLEKQYPLSKPATPAEETPLAPLGVRYMGQGVPYEGRTPALRDTTERDTTVETQVQQPPPAAQVAPAAEPAPPASQTEQKEMAAAQKTGVEPSAAALITEEETPFDPLEEAQKQYFKKVQEYKPPKFKRGEKELAKEIVDEVYKQKPEGNPLLNILTLGQYQGKFEQSRRIAEKLVAKEIVKERQAAIDKHRENFLQQARVESQALSMQQKSRMDQARLEQMQAKSLKLNVSNPAKVVENLTGYKLAQQGIHDVIDAGEAIIKAKQEFPMGKTKALKEAAFNTLLATPEQAKAAAVSLGLAGAGGSASLSTGGRVLNSELFKAAADKLFASGLSPEQTAFMSRLTLAIQQLGKAREGGRMTDADLKFYLNNLAAMDSSPQALLDSINYLSMVNARTHNLWAGEYSKLPGMVQFGSIEPRQFTPEDYAGARMMTNVPMPTVPGAAPNPVAGGVGAAADIIGQRIAGQPPPSPDAEGY